MASRRLVLSAGLAVLAVLGVAGIAAVLPKQLGLGTDSTTAGTSIEAIIARDYPSAQDKQGTGGVTVTVRDLYVLDVHSEIDGDWHVTVTDGRIPIFITEITPAYQASEGSPPIGSTIDETGTPFCDVQHENESWHGDTCWEIHPVTSWRVSAQNLTAQTAESPGLNITISYGQNPVPAGSEQTINIRLADQSGQISNRTVFLRVVYASGLTTLDFACITSSLGTCSVAWTIGSEQMPGIYRVTAEIGLSKSDSTFEVD